MRLVLHPDVYSDIAAIMSYYEQIASPDLADQFYAAFKRSLAQAVARPESYPARDKLRRVNFQRFPYHFLFRLAGDEVRVLVVRHHRRRPSLGTQRE